MQDDINWKLSSLLDDELDPSEAIGLLEQIYQDSALLDKWYGYQTIRQALRAGGGIQPQPDFLERVRIALADEVVVSSDLSRQGRWVVNFKRFNFGRWTMPLALTAIVAVFVVIVSKRVGFNAPASAPQLAGTGPTLQFGAGRLNRRAAGSSPLEDYYLLVHSEDSLYLTGPQHVLGYARIVSHGEQ